MSAIRNDEKLWTNIKRKLLRDNDNKWTARLAQRAVSIYKEQGGTYSTAVPRTKTSLYKWTKEEWGYAGKPRRSRYLPKKVRERLSTTETARENKAKGDKLGKRVPYSDSVKAKMREEGIF